MLFLAFSQEAFFNDLRIFGAKPNLTLVFLCVCAVRMNTAEALIYGLSTGLFIDIVYGRYIGLYGLLYMYTALVIAHITHSFSYSDKLWWPAAVSPVPVILYTAAESFIIRLLAVYTGNAYELYNGSISEHITGRLIPVIFYNCICIAVLSAPVILFLKRKPVTPS